jgi:hypothetical protein
MDLRYSGMNSKETASELRAFVRIDGLDFESGQHGRE